MKSTAGLSLSLLLTPSFWVRMCMLCFVLLAISYHAQAAIEVHEFTSDTERDRYQHFIDDMRCPKCQNQNLSGSDSPIAQDLRKELYLQIKEGRSDQQIVDFMVERYGEFILYKPRLTPATVALWGLPIILLLLGVFTLAMIVRRRRTASDSGNESPLSVDEQARLDTLLNKTSSNSNSNNQEPKA